MPFDVEVECPLPPLPSPLEEKEWQLLLVLCRAWGREGRTAVCAAVEPRGTPAVAEGLHSALRTIAVGTSTQAKGRGGRGTLGAEAPASTCTRLKGAANGLSGSYHTTRHFLTSQCGLAPPFPAHLHESTLEPRLRHVH